MFTTAGRVISLLSATIGIARTQADEFLRKFRDRGNSGGNSETDGGNPDRRDVRRFLRIRTWGWPAQARFGFSGDVHTSQTVGQRTSQIVLMPWGLTRFHHKSPRSLSAVTIVPFDSFAALSRSGQAPVVYHRRKPMNLRIRVGAANCRTQAKPGLSGPPALSG